MSKAATKKKRAKGTARTPGSRSAWWRLRACPFCGGKMEIRQIPGRERFGSECQYEGCRALGPIEDDPFRAVQASNRRGFHSDEVKVPLEHDPKPVLNAAYWWRRMHDPEDVCEFRIAHQEHGLGYWASGADALQRKLTAIGESQEPGWTLDIRSLLHGERKNITTEEARAILSQDKD